MVVDWANWYVVPKKRLKKTSKVGKYSRSDTVCGDLGSFENVSVRYKGFV